METQITEKNLLDDGWMKNVHPTPYAFQHVMFVDTLTYFKETPTHETIYVLANCNGTYQFLYGRPVLKWVDYASDATICPTCVMMPRYYKDVHSMEELRKYYNYEHTKQQQRRP